LPLLLSVAQLILENHAIYIIFLCKCVAFTIVERTPTALLHCLYSSRNFGKPRHLVLSVALLILENHVIYIIILGQCVAFTIVVRTPTALLHCVYSTRNFGKPRHLVLSVAQLILENHVIFIITVHQCVAFTIVEHTPTALLHCLFSMGNFGKPRHLVLSVAQLILENHII
jgi:hypothetical protein